MNPKKLNNPYQQSILVEAQAIYYPGMIQIYIPKVAIVRHPSGFDGKTRYSQREDSDSKSQESTNERSLRRTAKKISDYILCNDFDMFVTFTIKSDRQNLDRSRNKVMDWLSNQRKINGRFRYLVVPEFHKDKASLHFHALIGNYPGKIKQAINPKTGKPVIQKGKVVYQLVSYRSGFNNVKLIGDKSQDRTKLAAYIKKYITKDMPVFPGRQRYWVSKGLKLPLVVDNPEKWYEHVEPVWKMDLENGTLMRFDFGQNALVDMFLEANQ